MVRWSRPKAVFRLLSGAKFAHQTDQRVLGGGAQAIPPVEASSPDSGSRNRPHLRLRHEPSGKKEGFRIRILRRKIAGKKFHST